MTGSFLTTADCTAVTRKMDEVNAMFNMRNSKTKKIISTVIVVILVLAMIIPMALSALMY